MVEDGDPVGQRKRLHIVVSDKDDRSLELVLEFLELPPHLVAQLGVEMGERLVHQKDPGLSDQGPAQGDPLFLASAELRGISLKKAFDFQRARHVVDPAY